MKKIGQKEILDAILMEALVIKRKKELFAEAQKINQELKTLNEEIGARTGGFGPGFASYEGPGNVMGLSTQSTYEPEEDKECSCKLDQFPQLEKEIDGFGVEEQGIEGVGDEKNLEALTHENKELKEKLAAIQGALSSLNEGFTQPTAQVIIPATQPVVEKIEEIKSTIKE